MASGYCSGLWIFSIHKKGQYIAIDACPFFGMKKQLWVISFYGC